MSCAASLKFVDTIEVQVREQGVVVLVWNKESSIWKESSMNALIQRPQLKYIGVGDTRVVTSDALCQSGKVWISWQK